MKLRIRLILIEGDKLNNYSNSLLEIVGFRLIATYILLLDISGLFHIVKQNVSIIKSKCWAVWGMQGSDQ